MLPPPLLILLTRESRANRQCMQCYSKSRRAFLAPLISLGEVASSMAFATVAVLILAAIAVQVNSAPADSPPAPKPTYTTKYDNFNVDMILKNGRLLKNYVDCLMGRKKCTPEGQLLKEIIPDALRTECSRCSPRQKQQAGHILAFLLQERKDIWEELLSKYDPEGSFRKKYEIEAEEEDGDYEE